MKNAGGFTIVEVLVATVAALLVLAAVASAARFESRFFDREASALERREAARRVLGAIGREIRSAGFDPSTTGSFDGNADGIAVARRDSIELRADRHGGAQPSDPPDGELDPASDERVSFARTASGQISEGVGNQVQSLTSGVTIAPDGFLLRYFDGCGRELVPDANGLVASDRQRVRLVAVSVQVGDRSGEHPISGAASAFVRNRPPGCGP